MLKPIYCTGCGKRLEVPEGHTRSKLRCAECGVFNDLPRADKPAKSRPLDPEDTSAALLDDAATTPIPPKKKAKPKPESDPDLIPMQDDDPPPKPKAAPKADPEREVLIQGTTDDDGNPYQVTGDVATKRCPECDKKVEKTAQVCVHCGHDFSTKGRKERTFQPIDKEWEAGWPFQKRLSLFFALQAVNFVSLVIMAIATGSLGVSLPIILLSVLLQAFLVGTYQRLNLTRNQKGKIVLTHTWRYAFVARPTETVKWKEHDSIIITKENDTDIIAWVFVFILLAYGCLPGVAFWYFVVRPDKFTVALCKDHGYPETPIFRTANEQRAKEVMHAVSEITTLPVQK